MTPVASSHKPSVPWLTTLPRKRAPSQDSGAVRDFQRAARCSARADAGRRGAHPVVRQDVAEGRGAIDLDAEPRVPADDVGDRRGAAADRVVRSAGVDLDPVAAVGDAAVPAASVPMKFPAISFPVAPVPVISTPSFGVARNHVARPAAVPPIVLPRAGEQPTPTMLPKAAVPVVSVPI